VRTFAAMVGGALRDFCGQPHNRCPKGKSMKLTAFVLLTALVAGASLQVQAQRAEGANSQAAQACKTELQQLCQGQKGQQAEQCLKNNESKLSPQCKGAISNTPNK
jgi:uncharacterized protein HemX